MKAPERITIATMKKLSSCSKSGKRFGKAKSVCLA